MTAYRHDDCIEIISVEVVSAARGNAAFARSASQSVGEESDCDVSGVASPLPGNADDYDDLDGLELELVAGLTPPPSRRHGNGGSGSRGRSGDGGTASAANSSTTAVTVERYITAGTTSKSAASSTGSSKSKGDVKALSATSGAKPGLGAGDNSGKKKAVGATSSTRSRSSRSKTRVQDKTLRFVVSVFAFVFIVLSFLLVAVTLSMSDHIDELGLTCCTVRKMHAKSFTTTTSPHPPPPAVPFSISGSGVTSSSSSLVLRLAAITVAPWQPGQGQGER